MYEVLVKMKSDKKDRDYILAVDNMISKTMKELVENLIKIGFDEDFEIYGHNDRKDYREIFGHNDRKE